MNSFGLRQCMCAGKNLCFAPCVHAYVQAQEIFWSAAVHVCRRVRISALLGGKQPPAHKSFWPAAVHVCRCVSALLANSGTCMQVIKRKSNGMSNLLGMSEAAMTGNACFESSMTHAFIGKGIRAPRGKKVMRWQNPHTHNQCMQSWGYGSCRGYGGCLDGSATRKRHQERGGGAKRGNVAQDHKPCILYFTHTGCTVAGHVPTKGKYAQNVHSAKGNMLRLTTGMAMVGMHEPESPLATHTNKPCTCCTQAVCR
ncbi:hypothetical protein DUNSADRAFT_8077 [Dunaliella salina]|uniref:Encoded protein n=1 Tax=Dunaliella salina TaxID=3046 RepID=A0ABQ7GK29_DUNSA|nr:hypothetical protein DUNSADRAFT_8077 [Dunaliella salina]|eukprot:KAF5834977.1 hypothetical protein DUNSADRAFT_8077 [Dunaliella salina]